MKPFQLALEETLSHILTQALEARVVQSEPTQWIAMQQRRS